MSDHLLWEDKLLFEVKMLDTESRAGYCQFFLTLESCLLALGNGTPRGGGA